MKLNIPVVRVNDIVSPSTSLDYFTCKININIMTLVKFNTQFICTIIILN